MRFLSKLSLLLFLLSLPSFLEAQDYFNWGFSIANGNNHRIGDMVIDSNENVYMVGTLSGTLDFDPSADGVNELTATTNNEGYIVKYDKDGNLLWVRSVAGNGLYQLALTNSGNLIVLGLFENSVTFDNTITITNSLSTTSQSIFLASFSQSDGTIQVANAVEGTGDQNAYEIIVEGDDVYIAGDFTGDIDLDPGTSQSIFTSDAAAVKTLFIAKYTNGTLIWQNLIGTKLASSNVVEIEIDNNGSVYMIGQMNHDANYTTGAITTDPTSTETESYLVKYDATGQFEWDRRGRKSTAGSRAFFLSLEIDQNQDVSVLGTFNGTISNDFFTPTDFNAWDVDILHLLYAADGSAVSRQKLGGEHDQYGFTHIIDPLIDRWSGRLH